MFLIYRCFIVIALEVILGKWALHYVLLGVNYISFKFDLHMQGDVFLVPTIICAR